MTGLMILPYTEVEGAAESIASTATYESLQLFLETLNFDVTPIMERSEIARLSLERADSYGPREIALHELGIALYFDYLEALDYYVGCCRWLRSHLPDDLSIPLQFIDESGSPFFEIDFENLEQQILTEVLAR